MRVKFVLRDCDTYATIRFNDQPVGTIQRGRVLRHHNEPAFTVYDKESNVIGTAETFGAMRKIVYGHKWD